MIPKSGNRLSEKIMRSFSEDNGDAGAGKPPDSWSPPGAC
jgi:hypothetical protein